jgi:hypothetical protein
VMLQLLSVPGFWRVVGSLLAAESSVRRPIRGLGFPCPGGREIALGSTSDAPEQIAFGSTCDALGLRGARERESNYQSYCEAAMSSSTMQQVQLSYARSGSLLDHKSRSSSSSTTTWRRRRSIRRSLRLRVCVHPQFHFTHQQLLQHTALLPRAHGIETQAALRDKGNCKLSCVIPFCVSVYCLLLIVCVAGLFAERF